MLSESSQSFTETAVRIEIDVRPCGVFGRLLGETCGQVLVAGDSDQGYTESKLVAERSYAASRQA